MGYSTRVIEVGPEAEAFLEAQTAITFAGDAPEALRPFCYIIEKAELQGDLAVGQSVRIGEQQWAITALGDVAQTNLVNLGHVTLVFDGEAEPRMPGAIHIGGIDATPALAVGAVVVFGD
ncbi:MAG: PTS glucitol/sorbitol transporter subunit IIA [Arachnia sp.]